jgi:hypothetical protein
VLFVVTVFLIAQLAAVVYDLYPGPSAALDVCACPQFMPVEQKSVREPSGTCGV